VNKVKSRSVNLVSFWDWRRYGCCG